MQEKKRDDMSAKKKEEGEEREREREQPVLLTGSGS